MGDLKNIIQSIPPMKSGNNLLSELEVLPKYDDAIRAADAPVRLVALSDIYKGYMYHPRCHWRSIANCI